MFVSGILRKSVFCFVAFLAGSVLLSAASRPAPDGRPVSKSQSHGFQKEASNLLQQIKADAVTVSILADELHSYSYPPSEINFVSQGSLLNDARDQVNQMDQMLTRLRTIRRVTMPWEQKAIDRVTPAIIELTNATQSAVDFLNGHQDFPFSSSYLADSANMYKDASRVARSVGRFEKYAAAVRQVQELRPQLGMAARAGS